MAQYPNAIKTFTTKFDQINVVYAADMNDVQGEISAIETVLGTTPEASLNALDQHRHVDYGSVKNRLEAIQANLSSPSVSLSNNGLGFSVPSATDPLTIYSNWRVDHDDFGYASAAGFTTRDDAWWLISAKGLWDANLSGERIFALMFNGHELMRDSTPSTTSMNHEIGQEVTYFNFVPANTQVQLGLYQTGGKPLSIRNLTLAAILMKRSSAYFPQPVIF